MARIAGVDLPSGKRVEIGLTYIYGIGRTRAMAILAKAKVGEGIKVKDLSEDEVLRIQQVIQGEGMVEGFTDRLGGAEVTDFRNLSDRRPCQTDLAEFPA